MNVVSALLMFALSTMIGFMSAYRLSARVRGVNALIADIKRVQSRMEYSSASVSRILSELDTSPVYGLWLCMSERLNEGMSVFSGWREAYEKKRADIPLINALSDDTVSALDELFLELGGTDMDSQRRHFSLFFSRMEAILKTAESEHKTRGRVFRGVGTLGGVALAILFI